MIAYMCGCDTLAKMSSTTFVCFTYPLCAPDHPKPHITTHHIYYIHTLYARTQTKHVFSFINSFILCTRSLYKICEAGFQTFCIRANIPPHHNPSYNIPYYIQKWTHITCKTQIHSMNWKIYLRAILFI